MSLKQSMLDNKDAILENLPTQELKDAFLADLDKVEEPSAPSVESQINEAQAPDHVSEDLYDGVKADIESMQGKSVAMSSDEEKAAIEEALKNPPKAETEAE